MASAPAAATAAARARTRGPGTGAYSVPQCMTPITRRAPAALASAAMAAKSAPALAGSASLSQLTRDRRAGSGAKELKAGAPSFISA